MLKTIPFDYADRNLEVRASFADDEWKVAIFEKGIRANFVIYSVVYGTEEQIDYLMNLAKDDFIKWSDYIRKQTAPER